MVAIFAIFPTLPLIEMKMMGVALAAGVLIDATLVRGIALPAAAALLGRRGIKAHATVPSMLARARRRPRRTGASKPQPTVPDGGSGALARRRARPGRAASRC